jgi:hypothetical protein
VFSFKPALGTAPLARLSASRVQTFLNGQLAAGQSIRQVQVMRTVLFRPELAARGHPVRPKAG